MSEPVRGIDPRGPRFAAAITSALLLIDVYLGLVGLSTAREADGFALPGASIAERVADPAFLLLAVITALFVWGVAWPRTAPWSALFRAVVQPRLTPTSEREDPRPPRFAQGVGLMVASIGLVLQLAGVPWGLPIAAGLAFIASFLNAAFGFCLGCQIYLLLQRAGLVGRARGATA